MNSLPEFWIAVISKDHAMRAVAGGFIQISHGKEAPLKRLHAGDWLLIYHQNKLLTAMKNASLLRPLVK